jgi:phosphomannomutase
MARMFGTDGVRGVAGTELTIELAMKLGQAGAYVLTKEQSHQPTIIIGCDTRISGGMLANALQEFVQSEQMLFLWELPRHLQLHILQGNIK